MSQPSESAAVEVVRGLVRSVAQLPESEVPAADVPLGTGGLGFDSVRLVEVLLACESCFRRSFPAELLAEPLTIARLAAHAVSAPDPTP